MIYTFCFSLKMETTSAFFHIAKQLSNFGLAFQFEFFWLIFFDSLKIHEGCCHCLICLAAGVLLLDYSLRHPLEGLLAYFHHSMLGMVWRWLGFLLHQRLVGVLLSIRTGCPL